MSVDLRVRRSGDLGCVEFRAFHERRVGSLLERSGDLAAAGATHHGLAPLTLRVGEDAYTYGLQGRRFAVWPGDPGDGPCAAMEPDVFSDFVQDARSAVSLMIGSDVAMERGEVIDLVRWEPTLRALYDGRPAHVPGSVRLEDASGAPLDLARRFALEDGDAEMAAQLESAGFLHVAGVYDRDEMARLSDEMDRWFEKMEPGDDRSWWARTRDGVERCVRVTNIGQPEVAFPLSDDPRIRRIVSLPGDGHACHMVDLLVKPLDVIEGISDPPWHKDCSLGMHSYRCCALTVGISVTAADDAIGRLGVVPGSHRASLPLLGLPEGLDRPQVWLDTEPGDVTVHLSCTLHMAAPPRSGERRVVYLGCSLPGAAPDASTKRIRDRAGRVTYAPGAN